MNKKGISGPQIIFGFGMAVLAIILLVITIPTLKDLVIEERVIMDCDAADVTPGTRMGCIVIDAAVWALAITILAVALSQIGQFLPTKR